MIMAGRDRERWLNFVFLGMVELRTRMREMRGDEGKNHEKLGLKRISCASEFTIPDPEGTSPNLAGNITDMRPSKPNQASHTPDFSYPLVSFLLFSSSPISLFLVHKTTIIAEQSKVFPFYFSVLWSWVNTESSITPSAAYTEYSIHVKLSVILSYPQLRVDRWMKLQLPACLPTYRPQPESSL